MLRNIRLWYLKRKLKDKKFKFLFHNPPENEYVAFDTETTGLNTKKDHILSIGAVKIVDNKIDLRNRFYCVVKPDAYVNEETIKIHGLRRKDIESGIPIDEAIMKFLYFIEGRPLVGYYVEFDVKMISKYTKELIGIHLPNRQIEVSGLYYDYKIGKIPQGFVDLRFESIIRDLNIPTFGKHDALNDSIMTALIFLKLKNWKNQ